MQKIGKVIKHRFFLFFIFSAFCFLPSAFSAQIRVVILQDAESAGIKVSGFYEITDPSGKLILKGKGLKTTAVAYKGGMLIARKNFKSAKINIHPQEGDEVVVNGRRFKGDIQLIVSNNARVSAINRINLEDYVKGILYHEASHYWPIEALKAQAVVCRSYAVYQSQENKSKDYDVTADVYSQVYGGSDSERYRTNTATDQTQGMILTYKNKPLPAFFHATCGGHTQDASRLWNIDIPPLKGVACGWCKDSPHFNWHSVLSLEEIEDALSKSGGRQVGRIKSIAILGRDDSGRITELKISGEQETTISSKDFRSIIGPNTIRSANFNVTVVNTDAVFEGLGWGHGAGLCQWGAYFMAKEGKTFEEILKYYYPHSDVKTLGF
ncbi:MAG: SpoIID/LytB domain-containing protein [Candidatus Omnitrophica bacterium]|nr:SpoIID/LytB domain-containing protein [Candidatus Omnitrophota bacterium]